MSDGVVHTARQINPTLQGELTYLVNSIGRSEGREDTNSSLIPYSMVTGGGASSRWDSWAGLGGYKNCFKPMGSKRPEFGVGDRISLEYYVVGER